MPADRLTWMLGWATAQGLALLLLHHGLLRLNQPGSYFGLIWPLYIIAVALPLTMQMLADYRRDRKLWIMAAIVVFTMAACASYLGRTSWFEGIPTYLQPGEYFKFGLMAVVCWLLCLPFIEHRLSLGNWFSDYGFLFWTACSNNVRLLSAALFIGIFWALLGLWAGLFKVLKIDFFADLFTHSYFVYPVSCVAFGIGLSLYRFRQEFLLNHYRNILNLVAWLLPMVAGIMLMFLAVLPFQGLLKLWETGYATALMLGLSALMIVLFNADWQDGGAGQKFAGWLLRPIEAALLSMPVYTVLSSYALSLRVAQYGWTRDRIWAIFLVTLMGVYAFGYAWAVLKRDGQWLSSTRFVNIAGALTLIVLLLLAASPVLDPTRISVQSQMTRLLRSQQPLPDFDFEYLRFEGGRYGNQALKELLTLAGHPQAKAIRRSAEVALKAEWRNYSSPGVAMLKREELIERLQKFPVGIQVDPVFYDDLLLDLGKAATYRSYRHCFQTRQPCYLLSVDLNADGGNEMIVIDEYGSMAGVFARNDDHWQYVGQLRPEPPYDGGAEIRKILATGDLETLRPAWDMLKLGKNRYSVESEQ